MKRIEAKITGILIITLLGVWAAILFSPVARAAPPAQDPRPTVSPGGGGNGGGTGSGDGAGPAADDDSDSGARQCASVVGELLNWGYGPAAGVTTELTDGGWQLSTVSATDGTYGFGGLGIGTATLRVVLAPEQAETLTPHIEEAAIYLNCDYPTIANIAVSSGPVDPPAALSMTAGRTDLGAGDGTEIIMTVENSLPTDITNVVVTNRLPPELIALDVTAVSAASAQIINGPDAQLMAVYIERLASGEEANIRLTVIGAGNLAAAANVTNTATLFYRESVADQTSLDFTIGAGSAPVVDVTAELETTPETETAAATGTPEPPPIPTPTPAASPEPTEESESTEEFVPPGDLPTTGDNFVPPGFLPTTGITILPGTGAGFLWPVGGFGLVVLAIVGHYFWFRFRRR